MTVGLAMIEHVVLAVRFHDGAVRVARVVGGVLDALAPAQTHVAYADDGSAVSEFAVGAVAYGVAELVAEERGINKVIFPVYLAHGRRLEELVPFEVGACGVALALGDILWILVHRHHVGSEHGDRRALAADRLAAGQEEGIEGRAEAGVKVYLVALDVDAGVELEDVALPLAQSGAVGIVHVIHELVLSRRSVAHRDADHAVVGAEIIEVIPSVRAAAHVGRVHGRLAVLVHWVLILTPDDSFVTPVGQVVLGRGPADIVVHAERLAAEFVVRAVYVYAAVEFMRFAVGDILPARQIGIENLLFVHYIISPYSRIYFISLKTSFIAG